jgi:hypothetical protein
MWRRLWQVGDGRLGYPLREMPGKRQRYELNGTQPRGEVLPDENETSPGHAEAQT